MFKWTIIVLLALTNLCFFILVMPLEEALSPITKRELSHSQSIFISLNNLCQSKFVKKALKILTKNKNTSGISLDLYYCG